MSAARRDDGFTLIELVISSALGLLVLLVLGSFFVSSFSAQLTVTNTADAASAAQLLSRQLDAELRSASAIQVVNGSTTRSQLLIARTSRGSATGYVCTAWRWDAGTAELRRFETASLQTAPWRSGAQGFADSGASGWTLVASDVRPQGYRAGAPASGVFTGMGDHSVAIVFERPAGAGRQPVLIDTTVTGRQAAKNVEPACF